MENGNLKNLIIIFLLFLNIFFIYLYFNKQAKSNIQTEYKKLKIDDNLSNKNNANLITFQSSMEMDREFYKRLFDCTPSELATNFEHEYTIYGIEISGNEGNVCHFQERMDYNILDCLLPMDITRKYSEAGQEEFRELDELKRNNKSGMVQASNYINEINNDSRYCTHASTLKEKQK